MTSVRLSVRPRMLGPVSEGTVEVINLLRLYASIGLTEAKQLVDRCVFDGESVVISMPSTVAAESFVRAVSSLLDMPHVKATMEI